LLDVASYRNEAGEPPGYCDFARFGPPTRAVLERDGIELARISTGGTDCDELVRYRDEAQRLVASLTGRRGLDQVVMVPSTSAGLFQLAFALPARSGDELLVPPAEFPANVYPWVRAAARGGPAVRWLESADGLVTPEAVARSLTPRTVGLAVSAVDSRTGHQVDLPALREVLGGRLLLVDAVQGFGVADLDWSVADAVVAGGQKWLRAGWGTGFISVSDSAIDRFGDDLTGWTGVEEPTTYDARLHAALPSAARLAMTNPDLVAVARLATALGLVATCTVPAIEAVVRERVGQLREVVVRRGGEMLVEIAPERSAGILAFSVPGRSGAEVGAALARRGITCSVRADHVRLSPHASTPDDTVRLVDEALASLR
jgi:selenocysteine lyase/cysteine desulfurase